MTQRKQSAARKTGILHAQVEKSSAPAQKSAARQPEGSMNNVESTPNSVKLSPEQEAAAQLGKGPAPAKTRKKPETIKEPAKKKPAKADDGQDAAKAPKPPKEKKPMGRPTLFTQELADEICARLAEGKSARTVCNEDGMPAMTTFFRWLRENQEFRKQYDAAKQESADALVEEMTDIADDGTNDWMEVHDKEGNCVGYRVNGEHVQRSRLRVDTRKWIAAKLKPKKYGEKIDHNHGVQPDNPLVALLQQVSGAALPVQKSDHGDED